MSQQTSDSPLISILINNYNYGRFLGEAIESALAQEYTRVEIVVVDDGSTDHSRDIIASFGDRIRPVFQANSGQAAAFNAGFAECRGEIICLLDADDRFRPGKAKVIAEIFRANPEAAWVFHALALFGDVAGLPIQTETPIDKLVDVRSAVRWGKLRVTAPATSALTFRRALLARLLPMPVEIRITSDNYLKFASLGIAVGVMSGATLAEQRIHDANAYTLSSRADSTRGEIAMLTAHHMRLRFPQLKRIANGVYSRGLSQWLGTSPRGATGYSLARRYARGLGPLEMGEVVTRTALNVLRRVART